MHIKPKLDLILSRIKFVCADIIAQNHTSEYLQGFEHAVKLFRLAVVKEFKDYVQIEVNKEIEIRELKNKIERLNTSIENAKRHNNHLELMLKQVNSKGLVKTLSNSKKKKIYRAIEEMTGHPYEYVKEQFLEIIEGKGVKSA